MQLLLNLSLVVTTAGAALSLIGGSLAILYQHRKDRGQGQAGVSLNAPVRAQRSKVSV